MRLWVGGCGGFHDNTTQKDTRRERESYTQAFPLPAPFFGSFVMLYVIREESTMPLVSFWLAFVSFCWRLVEYGGSCCLGLTKEWSGLDTVLGGGHQIDRMRDCEITCLVKTEHGAA